MLQDSHKRGWYWCLKLPAADPNPGACGPMTETSCLLAALAAKNVTDPCGLKHTATAGTTPARTMVTGVMEGERMTATGDLSPAAGTRG